jgi:hypothetical protein
MKINVVNPRLIDVFGSSFTQDDVDFAIPRLDEDIPLYIDPFLLWVSERPDYRDLHQRLIGFFRLVAEKISDDNAESAARFLSGCEEQPALGLGYASGSKRGSNIGPKLIAEILRVHRDVPQLRDGRIRHMEELQLVVPGMAEDRMSDTAAAVLKDFFIEYSAQQAADHGIPTFSLAPPSSIQVDISQSGETAPNCW